jgi:chromosome segregation ATPase
LFDAREERSMTETTEKPTIEELKAEEHRADEELAKLQAELAEAASLDPARLEELTESTADELARREQRRGAIPRLIRAWQIRRLKARIGRLEAELEPLYTEREAAGVRRERLIAKRHKVEEEILEAQQAWADPNTRIQKREARGRRA